MFVGAKHSTRSDSHTFKLIAEAYAREHFNAFLPGGASARALEKMLAMFTGLCLEYEVQLVLRAADVQGIRLDAAPAGGRLGWDTFLITQEAAQDRADVRYELHALP